MGSLLGVADTKGAIYDALPADGVAVINADDAFAPYFAERAHGRRLIRFGLEASADVSARDDRRSTRDGARFTLVTPHGDADSRAARCRAATTCSTRSPPHRSRWAPASRSTRSRDGPGGSARRSPAAWSRIACANGAMLIDDSYNANPGSLNAGDRHARRAAGGERWLVLGDMRELGDDARRAARRSRPSRARAPASRACCARAAERRARSRPSAPAAEHFETHAALADALRAALHARRARAGQGLARQRDGQGRARRCCRDEGRRTACCLN